MADNNDPLMEMVFSFYGGVSRKAPGSNESTLKAISLLPDLDPNPQILEFGCGSGVASIPLGQLLDGEVDVDHILPKRAQS